MGVREPTVRERPNCKQKLKAIASTSGARAAPNILNGLLPCAFSARRDQGPLPLPCAALCLGCQEAPLPCLSFRCAHWAVGMCILDGHAHAVGRSRARPVPGFSVDWAAALHVLESLHACMISRVTSCHRGRGDWCAVWGVRTFCTAFAWAYLGCTLVPRNGLRCFGHV